MFEPKYLIRLDKKVFSCDQAVCLGSQLKSIIRNLNKLIEPLVWFGADVDALSSIPEKLGIDSFQLRKIGNSHSIINLCENIDQFLSGVFIAIQEEKQNPHCSELHVGTEDRPFRPLNLDGILIEIRTFDTSYLEIYSDNLIIIKELSKTYKTKIDYFQ